MKPKPETYNSNLTTNALHHGGWFMYPHPPKSFSGKPPQTSGAWHLFCSAPEKTEP